MKINPHLVGVEGRPPPVKLRRAVGVEHCVRLLLGEVPDALLREHAHVDLESEQREHGEREHRQDDHVLQVLDRLDHGAHDRLQTWNCENENS